MLMLLFTRMHLYAYAVQRFLKKKQMSDFGMSVFPHIVRHSPIST